MPEVRNGVRSIGRPVPPVQTLAVQIEIIGRARGEGREELSRNARQGAKLAKKKF